MFIESDNVAGGYLATNELLDKGYRKIGTIIYNSRLFTFSGRYEVYKKALCERGLPADDGLRIEAEEVSARSAYEKTPQMIKSGVDGIFCCGDLLAMGAINLNGSPPGKRRAQNRTDFFKRIVVRE